MDLRRWAEQSNRDPQWWLRTVLGVAAALLLLWLLVVSRMEFGTSETDPVSPRIESVRGENPTGATGSQSVEGEPRVDESSRSGPFLPAVTTFLVLAGLLAGVWFLFARKTGSRSRAMGDRTRETIFLSSGSELKIVEINDEIWVVGVSPQGSVQLLHRYSSEEWVEPESNESPEEFRTIWNRIRGRDA